MATLKMLRKSRLSSRLFIFALAINILLQIASFALTKPALVNAQEPPAPVDNEIITTLKIENLKDIGDADLDEMRGPVVVYWFDGVNRHTEKMQYDPSGRVDSTVVLKSVFNRDEDDNIKVFTGDWWVCLDEVDVALLNPLYDFKVEDTPDHETDGAPDGTSVCKKTAVPSGGTAQVEFIVHDARYTAGSREKQCEGAIEWILCPMIEKLFGGIRYTFEEIFVPLLDISPLRAGDDNDANRSAEEAVYSIWNNFRIIANVLFIIVFIVAMFGQATGTIFSNYDIKRMLPRLVIGVIGIQLSWFIIGFVIDLFNVLGAGVHNLILAPVGGFDGFNLDFGSRLSESVAALLLAKGVLGGFRLAGTLKGIIGFLPIMLTAILIFLVIAVAVLLIRALAITLLIVLTPIAFVAWILPNTQGLSKFWWGTLWKLLFMYPLIVALVALGELSAELIGGRESNDVPLQLASIVALFAPYFLIPQTFQFAGGFMSSLVKGFDGARKSLNQRIWGDPRDPGSYRAFLGRQRGKYNTQRYWRNVRDMNRLVGNGSFADLKKAPGKFMDSSTNFGIPFSRGRTIPGSKYLRGGWRLGNAALRSPRMAFQPAFGIPIDQRMAERNRMNREYIKLIGDFGDDDIIHSIAGSNYNLFTGEPLSRAAINAGIRFRDDDSMVQGAYTYLFTQAGGSPIEAQELINNFHRFASDKKLADFERGMWLGVAFGSQGAYRDLKHRRPEDPKRYSYVADRLANDEQFRRHVARKHLNDKAVNKNSVDEDALSDMLNYRNGHFDVEAFTRVADQEFRGRIGDKKMEEMLRESIDAVNQRNYADFTPTYIEALEEGVHRVEEVLRKEAAMPKPPEESFTSAVSNVTAMPTGDRDLDKKIAEEVLQVPDFDKEVDNASVQRDLANISKLRAGLIDMMARRELNVEDPTDPSNYGLQRDPAGAKLVHWRKADIRRELEERQRLGLEKEPQSITSQRIADIQRDRIEEILHNNVFPGSLGTEQQIMDFIRKTEWVHDENRLRQLRDSLQQHGSKYSDTVDPATLAQ